jgi:hypothetical protein
LPCAIDHLGVGRGDLSDEQWSVLQTLLPVAVLGRPAVGRRIVLIAALGEWLCPA